MIIVDHRDQRPTEEQKATFAQDSWNPFHDFRTRIDLIDFQIKIGRNLKT